MTLTILMISGKNLQESCKILATFATLVNLTTLMTFGKNLVRFLQESVNSGDTGDSDDPEDICLESTRILEHPVLIFFFS